MTLFLAIIESWSEERLGCRLPRHQELKVCAYSVPAPNGPVFLTALLDAHTICACPTSMT